MAKNLIKKSVVGMNLETILYYKLTNIKINKDLF